MRVNDILLYATLRQAAKALLGTRECTVANGSHVEMLAEVAGPGTAQSTDRRWFVRVISGPCTGAEFTVSESHLADQRSRPEPTPGTNPPR